jgi:hypothetical protein
MPWILPALAFGGSTLLGASASKSAAKTQAASTDRATELQKEMFEEQNRLQEPFRQGGMAAQNKLLTYFGLPGGTEGADYGRYARDFGMSDFTTDPGYGFRLAEGQKALDRQAAARGGLISGGALKAAQRYGQEMGSQEFTNAFNRYQTNRANQLQPLQSLMGAGQTATNTMGTAAANYGSNAGNLMTSGGAARASGYVGGANALASGLGQYMNYTQSQNLLNRLLPQQSTGGGGMPMPQMGATFGGGSTDWTNGGTWSP